MSIYLIQQHQRVLFYFQKFVLPLFVIVAVASSQSIEELLQQAQEIQVADLLKDAVVEEAPVNQDVRIAALPSSRRPVPEPEDSGSPRLFRPRVRRPPFLNRIRANLATTTTTTAAPEVCYLSTLLPHFI